MKPTVLAIVGPTCTGKTALSIRLAQKFNGEVIGCDSRTVYKHMDVGTAKPTLEERSGVDHHLFDVVEPDYPFTVANYKKLADEAITSILQRNKLPIVCGGTGFYARALLEGLSIPEVEPQVELRNELNVFADENGNQALHDRLRELDPETAGKLNPNDRFRVIRAIEVTVTKGVPFSKLICKSELPFKVLWVGLTSSDRDHFKKLIGSRFSRQLADGLIAEVRSLYSTYGACRSLTNTVNYYEFIPYLQGAISQSQAVEAAITHNYQLARKQMIWFRANKNIDWFEIDTKDQRDLFSDVETHVANRTQFCNPEMQLREAF